MRWFLFFIFISNAMAFDPTELIQQSISIQPCDQTQGQVESLHCPMLNGLLDEEQAAVFLRPSTYQKTIVTGASVSAGYGLTPARGPADHFLQAIGHEKNAVNRSMSGGSSRQILKKLYESPEFVDASSVIAVDMFFWDTVRNEDCSLAALQKRYGGEAYRKLFQKKLILATVPSFRGDQKPECVERINTILSESCKSPNCILLDGEKLFIHGQPDLMQADGLHPNEAGSKHLGEVLCRELIIKN